MPERIEIERADLKITRINEDEVKLCVGKLAPIDPGCVRHFRRMNDGYVYELDDEGVWQPVRDEGLAPLLGGQMLPCKDSSCLAKVIVREYDRIRRRYL